MQEEQSRELGTGLWNKESRGEGQQCWFTTTQQLPACLLLGLWFLYRVMGTQLPSPCSIGQTSVSCSGEMHMPFTAKIPLQMLNRELMWPFHFCCHRVKTIPGRWTAQANEGEKQFSSRWSLDRPASHVQVKTWKGKETRRGKEVSETPAFFVSFCSCSLQSFLIGTVNCYNQSGVLTTQLF